MLFYVICSYTVDRSQCENNKLNILLDTITSYEYLLVFTQKTEAVTYANLLAERIEDRLNGEQFPIITVIIHDYEKIIEKKYESLQLYFETTFFRKEVYLQWQKTTQFKVVAGQNVIPISAEAHGITAYSAPNYQKYFNPPSKKICSSITSYQQVFFKEIRRTYLKDAADLNKTFMHQGITQLFIDNIIKCICSNKNRHGDFYGMLLAILHLSALNRHTVTNTTQDKPISNILESTCRFPRVLSELIIGYTKEQEVSQTPLPTLSM
ncbi:MAG: hypothetical protein JSR33_00680 [Proteobacteria bacterium]|nr:hypothetical protein [Pseudomonadota bacterium]